MTRTTPLFPAMWRAIRAKLPDFAISGEGPWLQWTHADAALAVGGGEAQSFSALAADMLLWAWQERPLNVHVLGRLLELDRALPFLSPKIRVLASALLRRLAVPPDAGDWSEMRDSATAEEAEGFLAGRLGRREHGLFWCGEAFTFLLGRGKFEEAGRVLADFPWRDDIRPVKERLMADWAFFALPPGPALRLCSGLDPDLWGLWRAFCAAELTLREGGGDEAAGLLADLRRRVPWHPNLALKLHGLRHPVRPDASLADEESVAVLLYSFNKADVLAATLSGLAATTLGRARVHVLDNGSTDGTREMLARAGELFGGRLNVVELPVNVGAPAARNWLLALPEVKAAAHVAFIDDDAILPDDWLVRLLARAKDNPGVNAVGGRIVDHTPPHRLQMADINLLPPADEARLFIPNTCIGSLDYGLFDYARPCLSVSGCCHLIGRDALTRAGDFDIRFSPTQFDDLERDLRAFLLHALPSLYDGGLRVAHMQHSSLRQARDEARQAQVHGNRLKLEHKYRLEQFQAAAKANRALLWQDLEAKLADLDGEDGPTS